MALNDLERILIGIGLFGGVVLGGIGVNEKDAVLAVAGYSVVTASIGYTIEKIYRDK